MAAERYAILRRREVRRLGYLYEFEVEIEAEGDSEAAVRRFHEQHGIEGGTWIAVPLSFFRHFRIERVGRFDLYAVGREEPDLR